MNTEKRTVKVAVIGSGLAGLTAAHLLATGKCTSPDGTHSSVEFEPHIFEKSSTFGMDGASISAGDKQHLRIDVPMRSFMSGYYSHLFRLYTYLKVPIKAAKFSFGWYRIEAPSKTSCICMPAHQVPSHTVNRSYINYSGSATIGLLSTPHTTADTAADYIKQLFAQAWRVCIVAVSYLWLMTLSLWFHHRGHLRNPNHPIATQTLREWFEKYGFHPYFVHEIFVPLFSAVCTNTWQSMLNYPAVDVLEYMAMGLFQESYVVDGGVCRVVDALASPLKHAHLGTQIVSIEPSTQPERRLDLCDQHGNRYAFDHVVFAVQGNQALWVLQQCRDLLESKKVGDRCSDVRLQTLYDDLQMDIEMLQKFHYDTAVVINHTDLRLLPGNPSDWQALNLATLDTSVQPSKSVHIVDRPHDTTMTTHILNMTHKAFDQHTTPLYMQTTNPCIAPSPDHILSVSRFERATVTIDSKQAIETSLFPNGTELGPCQGKSGIWFAGSYCWKGIPLLEGCVASAEKVVADGIAVAEGATLHVPW